MGYGRRYSGYGSSYPNNGGYRDYPANERREPRVDFRAIRAIARKYGKSKVFWEGEWYRVNEDGWVSRA